MSTANPIEQFFGLFFFVSMIYVMHLIAKKPKRKKRQKRQKKYYNDDKPTYIVKNRIEKSKSIKSNSEKNYEKGLAFEKYVVNLFSEDEFTFTNCTSDKSHRFERRVESDSDPDLTFRYKRTGQLISAECKFRSFYEDGKVTFAPQWKINHYINYAKKNRIPTYLILGLGGEPDNPDRLFCVPIEKAKYTELYLSLLEKYECEPDTCLEWINNSLV